VPTGAASATKDPAEMLAVAAVTRCDMTGSALRVAGLSCLGATSNVSSDGASTIRSAGLTSLVPAAEAGGAEPDRPGSPPTGTPDVAARISAISGNCSARISARLETAATSAKSPCGDWNESWAGRLRDDCCDFSRRAE
jgi:hypothetical protein